jgi:ATP-binding protein involved in chromosome partitioning
VSQVTQEQVLDALRAVQDPDLHQDIVTLGFITRNEVEGGTVRITINLTTPACPMKAMLKEQAEQAISALEGVEKVEVEMAAKPTAPPDPKRKVAPGVRNFVAVSSGKGGVGKSTVTVNLAVALAQTGAKVGVLDCDIYGPDIPIMMGITGEPETRDRKLMPKERYGIQSMSIGYLLPPDQPVVWRGPMIHRMIEQFLSDVEWGELDYLLIDMPPGTGDAQLSLAQLVPLTGSVLVTTPQAVSTLDVSKAVGMFEQVEVEMLGVVENMAGYVVSGRVDGSGAGTTVRIETGSGERELETGEKGEFETVLDIFGEGGADKLSKKHGFPVLGRIPLHPAVRIGGDDGDPVTISDPDSPIAKAFVETAGQLVRRLAIKGARSLPVLQ